jgi:CRISPR/Cas system type I-B associated protein Csh2 (Cas7 group RAMP superfamily)
MTRITTTNIRRAIDGCLGNYSTVAQRLGVTRGAITQYFKKHPEMKERADQEREKLLDIAESQIAVAIREGDRKVCMWFADNHGKERGYGKKIEMNTKLTSELSFKDRLQHEIKVMDNLPLDVKKELIKKIAAGDNGDHRK